MELRDGTIRKKMRRWEAGPPVRFLTFSCYRRVPCFGTSLARDLFALSLSRCRERFRFRLVAWVVMPEHIHLILVPDPRHEALPTILRSLKQPVAQSLIRAWRRGSSPLLEYLTTPRGEVRVWQEGGGFDRNIRSPEELAREIEYIHQNPVERGLVATPTDWAWSSARWYAGQREGTMPIDLTGVHWGVKTYT